MAKSKESVVLSRREALLLSATAGLGGGSKQACFRVGQREDRRASGAGECVDAANGRSQDAVRQGAWLRGWRRADVQGSAVRGNDGWRESMVAGQAACAMERRVSGFGVRRELPADPSPVDEHRQTFLFDWDDGWQSEDMLKLNIWTPSLAGKRPVMLYMHGGGFSFGSSYELPSHDGAQMARHHEVVQVSVNHRLNILGFFDAAEIGGSAYEGSANAGMTDLVAALKWVQENIENFSGDPNRVMIYGQSGGGSKVTTLMGMPSAVGLIHRAAAQSGGGGNIPSREQQKELARQTMKELGLAPKDIGSLQKMEWSKLFAAGNAAAAKINPPGRPMAGPGAPGTPRVGWSPCVDGKVINLRSFFDAAPDISKNVPMLIGSVSEEGNQMSSRPTEEEWHANLAKTYGEEKATAIVAALKKAYPRKKIQTLSYICSGTPGLNGLGMRNNAVKMARLKHELQGAPAFAYYFTWQTQILDGVAGAWHTADLQFCFDNTKRCEQGTGNTPEAQALAKRMASSWAAFATTGNPSIPGLNWAPTDSGTNRAMIWDNECRMADDPEAEARKIILT